jgi:hypothetical protein
VIDPSTSRRTASPPEGVTEARARSEAPEALDGRPAESDDGRDPAAEQPPVVVTAEQPATTDADRGRWLRVAGPWLLVLGVTLVSLWLRVRSPMWLVDAPNDDGLFARLAGHLIDGEWLGPYNELTLAKGPGYPLFMAVAYRLHLPLKLAEHGVHLLACAVTGLAVWRVFRSRAAGLVAYVALALNPAYLGATAARIARDPYYGSLGLLLAGAIVLVVASVPDLAARGPRWAVPAAVVGGPAVGVVAAGYYLTREERIWLMPALAVAVLACVVGWPRHRRLTVANGLVLGAFAVLAGVTGTVAVGWTASQNEQAYGTSVTADLADGEIARAYREWQRVEAGRERRFVTVSEAQRQAVYRVSPAAAEMAGAFSTEAADWKGLACGWVGLCDDFGPFFVWAMREAGTVSGHGGSGAESQHYFGQVADDIARACDTGALRCTARPIGPMPPLNRIDGGELNRSTWRLAGAFLAYDVGEPERPPSGGGGPGYWPPLTHPLRGVGSEAGYIASEAGPLRHQEVVAGLTDLYRWAMRIGVVVALAGLVAGVATRKGRRNWGALLLVAAALVAVVARLLLIALIDATAWPAAKQFNYILPVTDFLVLFVLLGTWTLAGVLLHRRAPRTAAPHPATTHHEPESWSGTTPTGTPQTPSLNPATSAP